MAVKHVVIYIQGAHRLADGLTADRLADGLSNRLSMALRTAFQPNADVEHLCFEGVNIASRTIEKQVGDVARWRSEFSKPIITTCFSSRNRIRPRSGRGRILLPPHRTSALLTCRPGACAIIAATSNALTTRFAKFGTPGTIRANAPSPSATITSAMNFPAMRSAASATWPARPRRWSVWPRPRPRINIRRTCRACNGPISVWWQ